MIKPGVPILCALAAGGLLGGVAVVATSAPTPAVEQTAASTTAQAGPVDLPTASSPTPTTPTTAAAAPSTTPAGPTPAARQARPETTPLRTTTTAAPVPQQAAAEGASVGAEVVRLTNAARADAGCAPLRIDDRLTTAAQAHSDDMAANGYFEHDSRDGTGFADRLRAAGYSSPGGENIARGQRTPAAVMQAWLDSSGHRRNIVNCSFTTIGVGHSAQGDYWTQDFGR